MIWSIIGIIGIVIAVLAIQLFDKKDDNKATAGTSQRLPERKLDAPRYVAFAA